jgi:hypothetical protein
MDGESKITTVSINGTWAGGSYVPPPTSWYRETATIYVNGIPSTLLITGKTSAEVAAEMREAWGNNFVLE